MVPDELILTLRDIVEGDSLGVELSRLVRDAESLSTRWYDIEALPLGSLANDPIAVISFVNQLDKLEKHTAQVKQSAKDIRLGGSCLHGADKGPTCNECFRTKGRLCGPYAGLGDGLEIGDYWFNCLNKIKKSARKEAEIRCNCTMKSLLAKLDGSTTHLNAIDSTWKDAETKLRALRNKAKVLQRVSVAGCPKIPKLQVIQGLDEVVEKEGEIEEIENETILKKSRKRSRPLVYTIVEVNLGIVEMTFLCVPTGTSDYEKLDARKQADLKFPGRIPGRTKKAGNTIENISTLRRFINRYLALSTGTPNFECDLLTIDERRCTENEVVLDIAAGRDLIEITGCLKVATAPSISEPNVLDSLSQFHYLWSRIPHKANERLQRNGLLKLLLLQNTAWNFQGVFLTELDLYYLLVAAHSRLSSVLSFDLSNNPLLSMNALANRMCLFKRLTRLNIGYPLENSPNIELILNAIIKCTPPLVYLNIASHSLTPLSDYNPLILVKTILNESCPTLETLVLNGCFHGECDDSLSASSSSSLKLIDMKSCKMSSPLVLEDLLNVHSVDFSYTKFTSQSTCDFTSMEFDVQRLFLQHSNGSHWVSPLLSKGDFKHLTDLNLLRCGLSPDIMDGVLAAASTWKALAYLNISYNSLKDAGLVSLWKLVKGDFPLRYLMACGIGIEHWEKAIDALEAIPLQQSVMNIELGNEYQKCNLNVAALKSALGVSKLLRIWNIHFLEPPEAFETCSPVPFECASELKSPSTVYIWEDRTAIDVQVFN